MEQKSAKNNQHTLYIMRNLFVSFITKFWQVLSGWKIQGSLSGHDLKIFFITIFPKNNEMEK